MGISVPTPPPLHFWSPAPYANLADGLANRKRNYLRTLVGLGERERQSVTAHVRGYVADGQYDTPDPSTGWGRLRQPAPGEWTARVSAADLARAKDRNTKPYLTVWTDDPIVRSRFWWVPGEEDVNMVMARLAVLDDDAAGGAFAKPFGAEVPPPDRPGTAKILVQTIGDFGITRGDKFLRDLLLDLAARIKTEGGVVPAIADAITARMTEWLDTLHLPVPEPSTAEVLAMSQWEGTFPGLSPQPMLRAFGVWLSTAVLVARNAHPTGSAKTLSDILGWLASLADRPLHDALPEVADFVSFDGAVAYSVLFGRWDVTLGAKAFVAPPPVRPGTPGALTRRILSCADAGDGRLAFRFDTSISVPAGWAWPDCDKDGIYWWTAVLKRHCAAAVLKLKDTADFHVTDLLRFAHLHGLFGGSPDPRVPSYVGACIKAALLHFKYWIDEPAADGEGGGEMTFWSENHQVQFHAAELLVGRLFPDLAFPRSGRDRDGRPVTGREHERRGRERLTRWLDRRLRYGFSEWCSPGYYNEDFPPLLNLVDFADGAVAERAAMVVDRLVFDLARFTCRGSFAASAGRAYFEHKAFGWEQSVGETVEVLFGSRGDHMGIENTAISLCTSINYEVPDALLAIGLDRACLDRIEPLWDRSRSSIDFADGEAAGIGTSAADDVAFWWGLGAYFTDELRDDTRRVTDAHANLRKTAPMRLLYALDDPLGDIPVLNLLGPHIRALLFDAAGAGVGAGVGSGFGALAALAPFPLNLALGSVSLAGISLELQSLIHFVGDLGKMLLDGLKAAWAEITGDDPPEPEIPKSVLQDTLESMLELFNRGNVLSRAHTCAFNVGDAMLCSVQNHRAGEVSFQKLPWIATLGCDACVWTNAPMTAASGGKVTDAGFEFFKHTLLLQGSEAIADLAKFAGVADMDDLKKEGLYEWGGSICLPRVVQFRDAAIAIYNFDAEHGAFSKTLTHAWFPTAFFDEVDPAPGGDGWHAERGDGGSWVFGRKGAGYVALYSARRVKWVRDARFDADPRPGADGTMGQGPFVTTELRADEGSNIWVCAIGSETRYGSFAAFMRAIRDSYLHVSGVGSPNQLQCTFDMPAGRDATVGGFRLELFDGDERGKVNGQTLPLGDFPRFENRYVEGATPGRVDAGETSYRIRHPLLDLWIEHDIANHVRTPGPPQATRKIAQPARVARTAFLDRPPAPGRAAAPPSPTTAAAARRRRFRLDTPVP